MGRRGPAPKPTALKRAAGNPGKRRLNAREPRPTPGIPACPDFLDQAARAEWARVAPELVRLGLLAVVDGAALAAYCQNYSRWRAAELAIAKGGLTYMTDSGQQKPVPEVGIAERCLRLIKAFVAEFGFTPASRCRLAAGPGGEGDEAAELARFVEER